MTLKEISNGPEWAMWIAVVFFAILSVVLLSGHGAFLIAGYNTLSKEEKSKYDEKKLCRVFGVGMSVITICIAVMALWEAVLPAVTAYICIFRQNRTSVPEGRDAVPLQTVH